MTRIARRSITLLLNFSIFLALSGCVTIPTNPHIAQFNAYVAAIDDLAKVHEEYGSISMSNPLLVRQDDKNYFNFDLPELGPKQYFDDAKKEVQGRAATSSQESLVRSSGLGVQGDLDQYNLLTHALDRYQSQVSDYYRKKSQYEAQQQIIFSMKMRVAKTKLDLALEGAKKITDPEEHANTINKALADYTSSLPNAPDPGAFPEFPVTDASKLPKLDTSLSALPEQARKALIALNFADRLSLLGSDSSVTTRDRSALITAAGDNTIEGIFRVLGEADKARSFKNKIVFYGVSMVSVDPGWRTRNGDFEADLNIKVTRSFKKKNNNKGKEGKKTAIEKSNLIKAVLKTAERKVTAKSGGGNPGPGMKMDECEEDQFVPAVAAVSPMTDIQNLDLANTQRNAIERASRIGLALQFMGFKLGASAFEDYVKRLESDIRTRTTSVPVAAFSAAGGVFGYQVGPTLTALTAPEMNEKSGYTLEKQSFPVLIVVGLDRDDLIPPDGCGDDYEPIIRFTQSPSWLPRDSVGVDHRLSEMKIAKLSEKINLLDKNFCEHCNACKQTCQDKSGYKGDNEVINKKIWTQCQESCKQECEKEDLPLALCATNILASNRVYMLKSLVFGSSAWQYLPSTAAGPKVSAVYPVDLTSSKDKKTISGHLIVTGAALDQVELAKIDFEVLAGTKRASVKLGKGELANGTISIPVTTGAKGAKILLKLPVKGDNTNLGFNLPVSIEGLSPATKKTAAKPKPNYPTVELRSSNDGKQTVDSVVFEGNLGEKKLSASTQILKSQVEKDKPTIVGTPKKQGASGKMTKD